MKIKKITEIILIVLFILYLTGCNFSNTSNEDLKIKVIEEINYLDNKIASILNTINSINLENYRIETREINSIDNQNNIKQEKSEDNSSNDNKASNENNEESIILSEMKTKSILSNQNNNIDWNNIKFEIEQLHSTWATIVVDLYKLNISSDIVTEFSNTLNIATLNIKNEDEIKSTETLSILYSFLPKYLMYATSIKENICIKETKYHILSALYNAILNNWNNVSNNINFAIESFTPVINNLEYTKGKEHITNRIYILLNELKNSVSTNDKEVFLINYKNIMNELNVF